MPMTVPAFAPAVIEDREAIRGKAEQKGAAVPARRPRVVAQRCDQKGRIAVVMEHAARLYMPRDRRRDADHGGYRRMHDFVFPSGAGSVEGVSWIRCAAIVPGAGWVDDRTVKQHAERDHVHGPRGIVVAGRKPHSSPVHATQSPASVSELQPVVDGKRGGAAGKQIAYPHAYAGLGIREDFRRCSAPREAPDRSSIDRIDLQFP